MENQSVKLTYTCKVQAEEVVLNELVYGGTS